MRFCEFAEHRYWLHPVEILMLLRIRECLGLVNPEAAHPLLATPVGRLYPVRSVPHDPVMDQALTRTLEAIEQWKR